ncbi:excalibur calcium-binding domain-containing protein [Streptomyces sp. NPDC006687]|uniref:excalibur calcium-binding domain-containing protein n=1 Tax=unclassified Streptomyces TaxID=2593676 RepID=UPI0033CB6F17
MGAIVLLLAGCEDAAPGKGAPEGRPSASITATASQSASQSPSPSAPVSPSGTPTAPAGAPSKAAGAPSRPAPAAEPSNAPAYPAPERTQEPSAVYYKNCDAAKAAGAAPIQRGQPGYREALDRDKDGIACDK